MQGSGGVYLTVLVPSNFYMHLNILNVDARICMQVNMVYGAWGLVCFLIQKKGIEERGIYLLQGFHTLWEALQQRFFLRGEGIVFIIEMNIHLGHVGFERDPNFLLIILLVHSYVRVIVISCCILDIILSMLLVTLDGFKKIT